MGRCMMRMLAVASAAPNRHNGNDTLFIGDFLNQPRRTDRFLAMSPGGDMVSLKGL